MGTHFIWRSLHAVTFTPKAVIEARDFIGGTAESAIFQIILTLYPNRSSVITSFDLAPCKALARIAADGELVLEALPAWRESMRTMALFVDTAFCE